MLIPIKTNKNMNKIINKESLSTVLILLPCIFVFSFIILRENASKTLVSLIVISLVATVARYRQDLKIIIVENSRNPYHFLIWALTLFTLLLNHLYGVSGKEIRVLLSISIFALYFPFKIIKPHSYQLILLVGCIIIFINSLYYNIYLDTLRWAGEVNPIPYASVAAVLTILSVNVAINTHNLNKKVVFIIAAALACASLILTETRGVWLATLCGLLIIGVGFAKLLNKQALIALLVLAVPIAFLSSDFIIKRYHYTKYEMQKIEQGDFNSSFGLRMQMWQATPKLIEDNFLLGLGKQHTEKLESLYKQGIVSKYLYRFNPPHYHNQFIDSVVRSGIIGLFFLLLLLFLPLYLIRHKDRATKILVGAVVVFYSIAGLTDAPFYNSEPFILYLFVILIQLNKANEETTEPLMNKA